MPARSVLSLTSHMAGLLARTPTMRTPFFAFALREGDRKVQLRPLGLLLGTRGPDCTGDLVV